MTRVCNDNIIASLKYKKNHYIKNILNGCIVELNDTYYKKLKKQDSKAISYLPEVGFFQNFSHKPFSLMIMLTRMCNLSCDYCFEKNIAKDISLEKEKISNIISFVQNHISEKPDFIEITYTGGEPFIYKTTCKTN